MDSGVETGNDSNDSSIVPQNQVLALSVRSEDFEQAYKPKLEIYFDNSPSNSAILNNSLINSQTDIAPMNNLVMVSEYRPSMRFFNMNLVDNDFKKKRELPKLRYISSCAVKHQNGTPDLTSCAVPKRRDFCTKMKRRSYYEKKAFGMMYQMLQTKGNKNKILRAAVVTNNTDFLDHVLKQGVSPNNPDSLGRTPLHLAASRGYTEITRILLSYDADPNIQDKIGNTPLHLAAVSSNTELVNLLLRAGTNVKSTDRFGNSPLDLAVTKLRVLHNCKDPIIGTVKEEVMNIIRLLMEYLKKSNAAAVEVEKLSEICSRLTLSNSTDQIQDDVKNLLSNLDSLSLSK